MSLFMKQKTALLASVIILFLSSCRKNIIPPNSLPQITQTGQNTLGFLLDNKVWVNFGRRCTIAGCNDNKVIAHLYKQPNGDFDLEVMADYTILSEITDQSFFFYTTNVTTTGAFFLDSNLDRGMKFIASRYTQSYKEYKVKEINSCVLTISRFDTTNKIISGSFKGILHNPSNSNDSIKIESGRFDTQLNYYK